MPKVVWVRSLVPKEKNSASGGQVAGADGRARQLDHGADLVVDHAALLGHDLSRDAVGQGAQEGHLLALGDQRMHDLRDRGTALPEAATSQAASMMARTCIS